MYVVLLASLACYDNELRKQASTFLFKKNMDFTTFELDLLFRETPPLNSQENPFMYTLSQAMSGNYQYMLFNDELPNGTSSVSKAHSKGILAFDPDENIGIYLLHSTPGFPDPAKPLYIESYNTYGQNFACFQLTLEMFEAVGDALFVTRPQVYASTFDLEWLCAYNYALHQLLTGVRPDKTAVSSAVQFGDFTLFYKNAAAGIEVWSEIAKYYQEDFYTETWLRSVAQEAYCGDFRVEMAGVIEILGVSWKETQDHSKWGVSQRGDVFCVGDNNFMDSQKGRSGATFCGVDARKAQSLRQAIAAMHEKVVCSSSIE